jgi:hypothetical protein
MKRTALKRKTKLKKVSPKKHQIKLWEICKQLVRKRDGNVCVICKKDNISGANQHTGHFIPSASCGAFLRYDLRNLHSSCYHCNINLGGNGAMFYRELVLKYGQDFVDRLFIDKNKIIKADSLFYEQKIKEYSEILSWNQDQLFDHTKIYQPEYS